MDIFIIMKKICLFLNIRVIDVLKLDFSFIYINVCRLKIFEN